MPKTVAFAWLLTIALLMLGCGGSSGSSQNSPPTVPVVTGHIETSDPAPPFLFSFTFTWSASSDPDQDPIRYYGELHRATAPVTFPFDFENDAVLVASSGWFDGLGWAVQNFPTGSNYVFRVKARDIFANESAWGVYEDDTLGSCPFVFSWDGSKFAFESDLFPGGRLGTRGYQTYLPPYPIDYYVMTTTPALKDGAYELQLTGERAEVDYVDEAQLIAIYYPDTTEVFAERAPLGVATFPGIDRLHTVELPLTPPLSAVHVNTGQDVTPEVAAMDDTYITLNEDPNVGYEYQTLELDLGDLSAAPQIKLIIDGQSVFPTTPEGAARMALFGTPTRVEVPAADGTFTTVPLDVVELPSLTGFRRVIVLDVTDAFLTDDYRIRLTWLFKSFVDAILVDTSLDQPIRAVPLPLVSADLHFRGFSGQTPGERYELVYDQVTTRKPEYFPGAYTKYGDVAELLTDPDDRFVIFFGGDEVTLRFGAAPPPNPGERRGFTIMTNGYYKDLRIDLPATVEPLPFGGMTNYPYDAGESYPDDLFHDEYRALWNTRVHPSSP